VSLGVGEGWQRARVDGRRFTHFRHHALVTAQDSIGINARRGHHRHPKDGGNILGCHLVGTAVLAELDHQPASPPSSAGAAHEACHLALAGSVLRWQSTHPHEVAQEVEGGVQMWFRQHEEELNEPLVSRRVGVQVDGLDKVNLKPVAPCRQEKGRGKRGSQGAAIMEERRCRTGWAKPTARGERDTGVDAWAQAHRVTSW
jgi:hypothetical protein